MSKRAGTAHFATAGWLQWLASLQPRREERRTEEEDSHDDDRAER